MLPISELSLEDYTLFTGMEPPEDFDSCLSWAAQRLHAETLYAYSGRDMAGLPELVQITWKQALALLTMSISLEGGAAGMVDASPDSASLGSFSYSGAGSSNSGCGATLPPGVRSLLPMLVAYGRGLRA